MHIEKMYLSPLLLLKCPLLPVAQCVPLDGFRLWNADGLFGAAPAILLKAKKPTEFCCAFVLRPEFSAARREIVDFC